MNVSQLSGLMIFLSTAGFTCDAELPQRTDGHFSSQADSGMMIVPERVDGGVVLDAGQPDLSVVENTFVDAAMPGLPAEGTASDECDTTAQCRQLYADAVDCVNSSSDQSYCACGTEKQPCASGKAPADQGNGDPVVPPPDPTPVPAPGQTPSQTPNPTAGFRPAIDFISLHYDHAPDKDDGHSAAADRTIIESEQSCDFIAKRTVAVAGTYGENANSYNANSEAVMAAVFNPCGGYVNAHRNWDQAVALVTARWSQILKTGGNIWVKEGGQSDLTADVVRAIKKQLPAVDCKARIKVVQHSNWNEDKTTDADLAFVKKETDYRKIRDANAYLNQQGGNDTFERAALGHRTFGTAWKAAFDYYNPNTRLDFSDTGELMQILGLGELSIDQVRLRYLEPQNNPGTPPPGGTGSNTPGANPYAIEIESVPATDAWSLATVKAGYSGSGYFYWTGKDSFNQSGNGLLTYQLTIKAAGRYLVEIHNRRDQEGPCAGAANDQCNDVFTKMDNGPWVKTLLKGAWGQWIWNTQLEPSSQTFQKPLFTLSGGTHTFQISARSRGMKIDAIRITPQS